MRGVLIIAFFFLTTCQETETPSTSFLVAHHAPLTTVVVSPPRHAVGVARNANITATFDTNVDAVTVDSDTFVVFAGGKRSGAYVSSTNTITFSPAQPFLAGEMVKTTLTASLEDTGGGPLTQPLVWEFHATSSTATATLTTPLLLGSATNWTRAIALGDLNGDRLPDAFIGNDGGANAVYWNDGDGSFSTSNIVNSGTVTRFVELGDADGDGDLDLLVANDGEQDVLCYNDGGSFVVLAPFGGASDPSMGLALGDVDADGDLDVAVGVFSDQDNVYLNDGTGNFSAGVRAFGTGNDATRVVAFGDVDNDGDLDVASGSSNAAQQNAVYLNDGAGNFVDGVRDLGTTGGTYGLALGDVDNDGDLDAVIGCYNCADEVRLNDGTGAFVDGVIPFGSGSDATRGLALGDLDGNGFLDVGVSHSGAEQNVVVLNVGSSPSTTPLCSTNDSTRMLAIADIDGDGDLDVATANGTGSGEQDYVCLNDGTAACIVISTEDTTCDDVDDDCDGSADDDYLGTPTTCGVGACAASGVLTCIAGEEHDSCVAGVPAATDSTCDDVDDDCDGSRDDDYLGAPTTCGVGACATSGVLTCIAGEEQDTCVAGVPAAADTTCDGIDEDCDGTVDEEVDTETACGPSGLCSIVACNSQLGQCDISRLSGCCETDDDCATPSACVVGSCNVATTRCELAFVNDCCSDASTCDDANACTTDSCELDSGACRAQPIAWCCSSNADCDDGDPCSQDACTADHRCLYRPGPCDTGPPCGDDASCVYSDIHVASASPGEVSVGRTQRVLLRMTLTNGALAGTLEGMRLRIADMNPAAFGQRGLSLRLYRQDDQGVIHTDAPLAEGRARASNDGATLLAIHAPLLAASEVHLVLTAQVVDEDTTPAAVVLFLAFVALLARFAPRGPILAALLLSAAVTCGRTGNSWRGESQVTLEELDVTAGANERLRVHGLPVHSRFEIRL